MSGKDYLSCAETARLVRQALKKAFPGQKFSVRSSTYAGGASIDVSWVDGPQSKAVDAVVSQYKGADFDGMIDLKTYNSDWLYPDGHAEPHMSQIGHSYGSHTHDAEGDEIPAKWAAEYAAGIGFAVEHQVTEPEKYTNSTGWPLAYQLGVIDGAQRIRDGARLVHFGADFILANRKLSPESEKALQDAVLFLSGSDGPFDGNRRYEFGIFNDDVTAGRAYCDYGSTLVWQVSQVDPARLDSALVREGKRRARNAAIKAGKTRFLAPAAKDGRKVTMAWQEV